MFWSRSKRIYLDYASSTPVLREALYATEKTSKLIGNPGSIHQEGLEALRSLDNSRERIAACLGCRAREFIFTSGLTEANNLAILGFARKLLLSRSDLDGSLKGTHWIVSSIEHSSVLECFSEIERLGGTVTHIDPNHHGIIKPDVVAHSLRSETVFVSIGWGNNEIGAMQPMSAVAHEIHEYEKAQHSTIIFHSDAGQAPLYISPQVHTLGVDLMTIGSGKLYGPRGIGGLYVSNKVELAPVLVGGNQERGLRAGTEKVGLAAGFAVALECVSNERAFEEKRLRQLRDGFAHRLKESVPGIVTNGDLKHSLPHMLNISIPNINAEYLVLALDQSGVALSTKSACEEGEARSHVVAALGGDEWRAQNTLRFSLGRDTTTRDLEKVVSLLPSLITRGT